MKTIEDIRNLLGLGVLSVKSHYARLVNLDKAPLDDLQKELIEARKSGIYRARRLYIARQIKTLGGEPVGEKRGIGG